MKRGLALLLFLLFLTGCEDTPVARDLDQRQVNEIVSLLGGSGLRATVVKERGGRAKYSVEVPESQYLKAVELLHIAKLPNDSGPGLSDLLSSKGILPPSHEVEEMRLDHALSLEIQELLEGLPGVVKASLVVRLRSVQEGESKSVAASVLRASDARITQQDISDLISKTIGSIDKDKIIVSLSPAKAGVSEQECPKNNELLPFLGIWKVPESEYVSLALTLLTLLLFVGLATAMFGFYAGRRAVIREVFSGEEIQSPSNGNNEREE